VSATLDQRMSALSLANEVRFAHAQARHQIASLPPHASREAAAQVLESDPSCEGMTVYRLLTACRRLGPAKAHNLCARAGVPGTKALGDLTDRQRDALASRLRDWGAA
jgi:hypothetical protein